MLGVSQVWLLNKTIAIVAQNICVAVKNPGRRDEETNVYYYVCLAACCIVQRFNTQPKMVALPNLACLSVKQAGVTAYDWLCVLTLLALRRRPRITQRALSKLRHDHHPLVDWETKEWPEVNKKNTLCRPKCCAFTDLWHFCSCRALK